MQAETKPGGRFAKALFDGNVGSAKAEGGAGAFDITIPDENAAVVEAGDGVVAGDEFAIFDRYIITGANIKAIVSAEHFQVSRDDIPRMEDGMRPICASSRGVADQCDVGAILHGDQMWAAIVFFPLGIIAVYAVDIRAIFADDGDVFRVDRTDEAIVPATVGIEGAVEVAGG